MSVNDGGPAFPMPAGPEPRVNATTHFNEGMSLRDYFAGQALPWAIKINSENAAALIEGMKINPLKDDEAMAELMAVTMQNAAEAAYAVADAMLAERAKKPT